MNKHGHSMYKNSGCRCDKCKAGAAAYMRAYRALNRDAINERRRELYRLRVESSRRTEEQK